MSQLSSRREPDADAHRRQADQERFRQQRIVENRHAEAPVLADLARAGFGVSSLQELRSGRYSYREAIPVLLRWLPAVQNRAIKEEIVRTLTVKWARSVAAPALIDEFMHPSHADDANLRWVIGNALSEVASDSVYEEIVALIEDPGYGRAREMLALALARMHDPRAEQVLFGLLDDPEVAPLALQALRKRKARLPVERLAPFLSHPEAWVRKEAQRLLALAQPNDSGEPRQHAPVQPP